MQYDTDSAMRTGTIQALGSPSLPRTREAARTNPPQDRAMPIQAERRRWDRERQAGLHRRLLLLSQGDGNAFTANSAALDAFSRTWASRASVSEPSSSPPSSTCPPSSAAARATMRESTSGPSVRSGRRRVRFASMIQVRNISPT
ncbi:hypothetical protein T484DRAFT_1756829 [Baffinella frigidus]|nr:hypothetical protein T484DRAFT_1756829 [Cryptophyta sp. CCMP2293]